MTLFTLKWLATIVIFIVTVIAGIWPLRHKHKATVLHNHNHNHHTCHVFEFPKGEALATGIFLAAALLHLLPDAAKAFYEAGYEYPVPFLVASISFLLLLCLEHIGQSFYKDPTFFFSGMALLAAIILSLHSFLEGAAIGLSANLGTAILIITAVVAHKGADSIALCTQLLRSHFHLPILLLIFAIFSLMTPLGILAGGAVVSITNKHSLLTPTFNALAAGTFFYMGTLHGLDRASLIRHCCNLREFTLMLIGFIMMALVAIWA